MIAITDNRRAHAHGFQHISLDRRRRHKQRRAAVASGRSSGKSCPISTVITLPVVIATELLLGYFLILYRFPGNTRRKGVPYNAG
jgi:hypothetical protein